MNCFRWKEGKIALARETPLALNIDSNFFAMFLRPLA